LTLNLPFIGLLTTTYFDFKFFLRSGTVVAREPAEFTAQFERKKL